MSQKQPFHWKTGISWKSEDKIVCRGYDTNELAENLSFTEMVFLLMRGNLPRPRETQMLNHLMVAFSEHAFSPSVVSARSVASGRAPLNAAVAAGILTFGDAHGPGHKYGEMIVGGLHDARRSNSSLESAAERIVISRIESGEKIPGLNQPQHINGDPRVASIRERVKALGLEGDACHLQQCIEIEAAEKISAALKPNILAAAGCILLDLGFSPQAGWAIGFLSRAFSCAAHAIEEFELESPWRARKSASSVDLLDLSLQGPENYFGEPLRSIKSSPSKT